MVDLLSCMREEYYLCGVKGEFEAEGSQLEELMRLKEVTMKAGVGLTVKIGGCEAITDMNLSRSIGAAQIVAPMIESAYAAKKFVGAAGLVFPPDELSEVELLINVETAVGVSNFDDILALPQAKKLAGLDIGRVDLAGSMGLLPEQCNSREVYDACLNICSKWVKAFPDKECTLGGFLNPDTIKFLQEISKTVKVGCESKKTIFSPQAIGENLLRGAYLKAIEFEQIWYENCMERYSRLSSENWGYFKALGSYKQSIEQL